MPNASNTEKKYVENISLMVHKINIAVILSEAKLYYKSYRTQGIYIKHKHGRK